MLSGSGILTLKNLVYDSGFLGSYIYSFEFSSSNLNTSLYKCVKLKELQESILGKYLTYSDTSIGTFQLMRYDRMYINTSNKACTFTVTFIFNNQGNGADLSNYKNGASVRFYNNGAFVDTERSKSVQSFSSNNFLISIPNLNLSYSSNYRLYYGFNVHFTSSTTNAFSGTVQPIITITVYHTYMNDTFTLYKLDTTWSAYSFHSIASGGLIDFIWNVNYTNLTTSDHYIPIPILPTVGTVNIEFNIENKLVVNEYNEGGAGTTSAAAEIGEWDI